MENGGNVFSHLFTTEAELTTSRSCRFSPRNINCPRIHTGHLGQEAKISHFGAINCQSRLGKLAKEERACFCSICKLSTTVPSPPVLFSTIEEKWHPSRLAFSRGRKLLFGVSCGWNRPTRCENTFSSVSISARVKRTQGADYFSPCRSMVVKLVVFPVVELLVL